MFALLGSYFGSNEFKPVLRFSASGARAVPMAMPMEPVLRYSAYGARGVPTAK